jgi:predicted membrane protein
MKNENEKSYYPGYHKGLGFGLVLMLIGIVFLGFNFGLIPGSLKSVIISWQMLLIGIGVINLFRQHFISGVILLFVGGFFLTPKLVPSLDGQFITIYWPLLLIAAGVLILISQILKPTHFNEYWNRKSKNHAYYHHHHHYRDNNYSKWQGNSEGFSENSVFANGEHIVLDPEFKGGDINAVFGGIKLDLRKTSLPVGETFLEVNAVFGGITIFVPDDWYVETHLDSIFGGFKDSRILKEPLDTTKKLIITGSCVFGGGELRN